MAEEMHAHWYLRFRRFKMEAFDLRRSSNMLRSLYVAASWGGWKDPLGIIVGGVDLGGMASGTEVRVAQSQSGWKAFYTIVVFVVAAVVEKVRMGRCRRSSRRVAVISGDHTIFRFRSSALGSLRPTTPRHLHHHQTSHVVRRPGNRR